MEIRKRKKHTRPNRKKKKPEVFTLRMTEQAKGMLQEKSEERSMNMSDYLHYLIEKDRPK